MVNDFAHTVRGTRDLNRPLLGDRRIHVAGERDNTVLRVDVDLVRLHSVVGCHLGFDIRGDARVGLRTRHGQRGDTNEGGQSLQHHNLLKSQ